MPGRSTILYEEPAYENAPSAFSTVFPGQLPVCCLSPVRALNTVLLPVLGLPARAMVKSYRSASVPMRRNLFPLCAGQPLQAEEVAALFFIIRFEVGLSV